MPKKSLPSPEVLRDMFAHDAQSGTLTWRVSKSGHVIAGKEASGGYAKESDWTIFWARECLEYQPDTGAIFWVKSGTGLDGREAGTLNAKGYRRIRFQKHCHMAHRLAWAMHHGRWPSDQIDHINGDKADNRIANLRECNNSQNSIAARNMGARNRSRWGRGVQRRKWGSFEAQGRFQGNREYLGVFDNAEDAREARAEWEARVCGEFAPLPEKENPDGTK